MNSEKTERKLSISFPMSGRNNTVGFSSQGKLFSNRLPCLSLIYDFKEILDGFPVSTELRNHRWNFGTGVFLQLLRVFQIFQECFNKGIKLIISSIKENVKNIYFFLLQFHVIAMEWI